MKYLTPALGFEPRHPEGNEGTPVDSSLAH